MVEQESEESLVEVIEQQKNKIENQDAEIVQLKARLAKIEKLLNK